MTDGRPDRFGSRREWLLPTMKWIRVLVVVVALTVLVTFLLKIGVNPVEAGKKLGH